jgi:peptidoglycan/LPS O-acetylase OafA/YrhL
MNYHPNPSWWLIHCWSLSVEEQFYLLWPATLALLGARRGLGVAAAFVVTGPLIRFATMRLFPGDLDTIHDTTFGTVGDTIAIGCLLAGFRDRLGALPLYRRYVGSAAAWLGPALVVVAYVADVWFWRVRMTIGPSALNLGIALSLDWCLRNPKSAVGRLLDARPLVAVGVGSYSLYLWQQLFLNRVASSPLQRFPLNLACAALVAAASYFLVERPSLRLRARLEARLFARPARASVPTT